MGSSGAVSGTLEWLRRTGDFVLDMIYPPTCLACDEPVDRADTICASCFARLRPITAPYCPVLGTPYEADPGPDMVSVEALADPPPFDRARSAVVYNEVAATLVSRLKYGDRPEVARFCAALMVQMGTELLTRDVLLVPVPLHPARGMARRYNQSAELASWIARRSGCRLAPHLVRRARKTRQQVGLSADGRRRNVAGAFEAHPELLATGGGRRIVLIDDVYTTGATLKAVTNCLRRGGIDRIDVLSFARVVREEVLPI